MTIIAKHIPGTGSLLTTKPATWRPFDTEAGVFVGVQAFTGPSGRQACQCLCDRLNNEQAQEPPPLRAAS